MKAVEKLRAASRLQQNRLGAAWGAGAIVALLKGSQWSYISPSMWPVREPLGIHRKRAIGASWAGHAFVSPLQLPNTQASDRAECPSLSLGNLLLCANLPRVTGMGHLLCPLSTNLFPLQPLQEAPSDICYPCLLPKVSRVHAIIPAALHDPNDVSTDHQCLSQLSLPLSSSSAAPNPPWQDPWPSHQDVRPNRDGVRKLNVKEKFYFSGGLG